MAAPRILFLSLLLSLLAFHLVDAHSQLSYPEASNKMVGSLLATSIDCGAACSQRCRLSSRPNLCKRACGTCCARCNCVPPGTSGNQNACPCYASLTTHGGRKKCP